LRSRAVPELGDEQRRQIAAWIQANSAQLPLVVQDFLALHLSYLATEGNLQKHLNTALRELRRALRITPSSERRRQSGAAAAGLPPSARPIAESPQALIEQQKPLVHERGEESKVAIRNIRRHSKELLEKGEKEGKLTEDDLRRELDALEKMTHEFCDKVDQEVVAKDKQLKTV